MPESDPLSADRALAHVDIDAAMRARIAALPSNDAQLADAMRGAPTVLAMVGTFGPASQPLRAAPILVRDAQGDETAMDRALARLTAYPHALSSLPELTGSAHGWGLVSAEDAQGIVRRVPLVASVSGTLVPGLASEMWRVASQARVLRLLTSGGKTKSVQAGGDVFDVQPDGSVRPWFSTHRPRPLRVRGRRAAAA